ncbi:hypothetical protein [Paenibacillus sp. DMB5]|uniref:hypothetical protein n=1 Tax=Paenibacillus sp. DMB5 TaxID=1780103 RepID=UPI00076BEBC0|nr:hypothetical protein [Paenibacillus sp. DMB5]KUP21962.1 hypothetical protein AWJ19_05980 [Paenibacillus sp. DMB5]
MGEELGNTASGFAALAEGLNTTASGAAAHAKGFATLASGDSSHAEGSNTVASASASMRRDILHRQRMIRLMRKALPQRPAAWLRMLKDI